MTMLYIALWRMEVLLGSVALLATAAGAWMYESVVLLASTECQLASIAYRLGTVLDRPTKRDQLGVDCQHILQSTRIGMYAVLGALLTYLIGAIAHEMFHGARVTAPELAWVAVPGSLAAALLFVRQMKYGASVGLRLAYLLPGLLAPAIAAIGFAAGLRFEAPFAILLVLGLFAMLAHQFIVEEWY